MQHGNLHTHCPITMPADESNTPGATLTLYRAQNGAQYVETYRAGTLAEAMEDARARAQQEPYAEFIAFPVIIS